MHTELSFLEKLEEFIRKFHRNEILRGVILFLSIGLFSMLLFLLVEYFLWLSTKGRTFLFWGFVVFVICLFYKLILIPIFKLLKIKQGLSYEDAARIIGEYFPEISDKVLNTLQLGLIKEDSELLHASIAQKVEEMKSFSFPSAVSYLSNKKYLPYFALPVLLFLLSFLIADSHWIKNSYKRLTNYNVAYTPPAPYKFVVLNDSLTTVQGESFDLAMQIEGKRIPEEVKLVTEQGSFLLKEDKQGVYKFRFNTTNKDLAFSIIGNNQFKENFILKVLPKPFIETITLYVKPPAHTKLAAFNVHASGNAQLPEGSHISWEIQTKQSDVLRMYALDTVYDFVLDKHKFLLSQKVVASFDYTLEAFNTDSKQREQMNYSLDVYKDAYPSLEIQSYNDLIESNTYSFSGTVEDDYGLKSLNFIVYPSSNPSLKQTYAVPIALTSYEAFHFTFDTTEFLATPGEYSYYFEVTDNDAINGFKSTRSVIGLMQSLSSDAIKDSQLDFQKDNLDKLSNSVEDWKKQNLDLEDLSDLEFNQDQVLWEDLQKAKSFAKQESSVLENLNKLTQDLLKNLENMETSDSSNSAKSELQDRMQEQLNDLKRNQEILDRLESYQSKIANETLQKEVEEYKQQKKIQEKNLGQLLELTKRFYVTEKNTKLASDLMELGEKQIGLSQHEQADLVQEQKKLQDSFKKIQDELDELMQENQKLLRPFDLFQNKAIENRITKDQQEALKHLIDQATDESEVYQKGAGQKMQELAEEMSQQQESQQMQSAAEDSNVLRQILDNLVRFSFSQEEVLDIFRNISFSNPKYGSYLTSQFDLKLNFRHINDSLFSLSLRQPSFGKEVHSLATQVDSHIDSALDDLAQDRMSSGTSHLHYSFSKANELAAILSDILDNMQMNMGGAGGAGKQPKQQLSDIIEKQKSLLEQEGEGDSDSGSDNSDSNPSESEQGEANSKQPAGLDPNAYTDSEEAAAANYDIYKQQQELKKQLADYLQQHGYDLSKTNMLLQDMDAVSLKILDQGASDSNRQQVQRILHQLIELQEANLQQEEDETRKASLDFNQYSGSTKQLKLSLKEQQPAIEQLNRESLHLTPYYRLKVKQYLNN